MLVKISTLDNTRGKPAIVQNRCSKDDLFLFSITILIYILIFLLHALRVKGYLITYYDTKDGR